MSAANAKSGSPRVLVVTPWLRGVGRHADAVALRAVRPAADDRLSLRLLADRARYRRPARHRDATRLDAEHYTGNGVFLETFDPGGVRWAVDQAMSSCRLPPESRERQIARVTREGGARFSHETTGRRYFELQGKMLARRLVPNSGEREEANNEDL